LRNLPYLYQLWCTLIVIEETVRALARGGWEVTRQRLVTPGASGMYMRVLRDGKAALVMRDGSGRFLRLIPEKSYGKSGSPLRSVSFAQRPDVTIELSAHGRTRLLLLDPKYKLDSETG